VDLSKARDAAFERALLMALRGKSELYLFHTRSPWPMSRLGIGEDLERKKRAAERSHLRSLVRSAKEAGVPVRVVSAEGEPARAIAAHAHLVKADLIVISRDFGLSHSWRTPRVAATVGRSAPVPVLIVPSRKTPPHSDEVLFKKVVVAVDFTVASVVALRVASDVVARGNGEGTAVHAVSYASPMVFSGGEVSGVIDDLRGHVAQAEARLRGAIQAGATRPVTPRVVADAPGQAILDVAAEVDADLVVMGVTRRNRFNELFLGSTFRTVVRHSLRPILAVPVAAGAHRWAGTLPAHILSEASLRAA
jgi:nucleotide-binding universal stress UspA family protein